MLLTEYLSEIAGTQEEAEFFEKLDQPDTIGAFAKVKRIPFVGKATSALLALIKTGSIAEFELNPQFDDLAGWEIKICPETEGISIIPGAKQRKTILIVLGAIAAIIIGFIVWRKLKKR